VDRTLTSPLVLLLGALAFLIWAVVLVTSPGGSQPLEQVQLLLGAAAAGYATFVLVRKDPVHHKRCRYLVLAFAVIGIVMLLGLAADQHSSRTWARLSWAGSIYGYVGSTLLWARNPTNRVATLSFAVFGGLLIAAGAGITLNCDPSVQRSWCDPVYEHEQVLAETIEVDGELERFGRVGASLGAAFATYFIADGATIQEVTLPPGEWDYEAMDVQAIEVETGVYTSEQYPYDSCRINVKVEVVPAGNRETIFVTCGVEG
jgi:hypothetical protein